MNKDFGQPPKQVDLIVVGGGIFGACAAWDATLRGLKVLLVEKDDFSSGASANSFKMVHGGIRYMQHLDLPRVRSSCHERSAFLRVAPHLVQPLPIAMPTFGYGVKGKPFLASGMWAYDVLTADRNRGISDRKRHIPWSRCLTRRALLEKFPNLSAMPTTGAVVFNDAQMYNPTRLVLAFIQSAVAKGAVARNYTAARRIHIRGGKVAGCILQDTRTGDEYDVACKYLLNASGPWAEQLLADNGFSKSRSAPPVYSRDSCFVINRRFDTDLALAVPGLDADSDAVLSRDARHLFLVPWRDYTLVGVWHKVWGESADDVRFSPSDLDKHLEEINVAYPELGIQRSDVRMWNAGLLPFGEQGDDGEGLSFGKQSSIIDHSTEHGTEGLVTLIGIRYTMGRADAARSLDILLGQRAPRSARTAHMPVYGGNFRDFGTLVAELEKVAAGRLRPKGLTALAHNHGTNALAILKLAGEVPGGWDTLPGTDMLRAEIYNAVRHEMVKTLPDVVFRRTDLATAGSPGAEPLNACADIVAEELAWEQDRRARELEDVYRAFPTPADTEG